MVVVLLNEVVYSIIFHIIIRALLGLANELNRKIVFKLWLELRRCVHLESLIPDLVDDFLLLFYAFALFCDYLPAIVVKGPLELFCDRFHPLSLLDLFVVLMHQKLLDLGPDVLLVVDEAVLELCQLV